MSRFTLAKTLLVLMLIGGTSPGAPTAGAKPANAADAGMRVYPSRYYIIHTDMDTNDVKEAVIRMNKMAEEYHERTRGFSGEIRERLPFYLFRNQDDYFAAGGIPGSAGVFRGGDLLALTGDKPGPGTWHVVQHEGFHQFAAAVIRGQMPPWLNEGIAEYFGESIFTGDGFVSGIIPPRRLQRVQEAIRGKQYKSIREMMLLSQSAWNSKLTGGNYDQAWSMVHFLAHGEDGKYQPSFVKFMQAIGKGVNWQTAWKQTFGDADGFEPHWRDYWLGLPTNPTADRYEQAAAATLASFYARATIQKQRFGGYEEFLRTIEQEKVKTGDTEDDWLPPDLLTRAARSMERYEGKGTLIPTATKGPQISFLMSDGNRLLATSEIHRGHVSKVTVETDDTGAIVLRAKTLINEGKKPQARAMLQEALKSRPNSPAANDAREMIKQTR
jgi:hypothetical protein